MVKPLATKTVEMAVSFRNTKEEMEVSISVTASKILSPFFVNTFLREFFGHFVGNFFRHAFHLFKLFRVHSLKSH